MEQTTDIFGIPVPSTDLTFLSFVIAHILISRSRLGARCHVKR